MTSKIYVPSEGDPNSELWIVGEAPGYQEEMQGRPFIGESGNVLEQTLSRCGLSRKDVFITNLCHFKPDGNKFSSIVGSDVLKEGLAELGHLLQHHEPNCIAALGAFPCLYLTGKNGISKYRGSILPYGSDYVVELNRIQKVIPTYHPANILRAPMNYLAFDVDFHRIVEDAKFPELRLPEREYIISPQDHSFWISQLTQAEYLACDIEAVKGSTKILCVGFADSPDRAVVFPYHDNDFRTRNTLQTILSSKAKKIFHFGSYDASVLRLNGYDVENYTDDTILQAHILNPELQRDLAYLASVYTREPYYKEEGRRQIPGDIKGWSTKQDKDNLYRYNGKDCCCTYEVFLRQREELTDENDIRNYLFEIESLDAALDMSAFGLLVDTERRDLIADILRKKRAKALIFLSVLAGWMVNPGSNKQTCKLLYEELGLPKRYKTDRETKEQALTADEDAIVSLITFVKSRIADLKTDRAKPEWNKKEHILKLILQIRGTEKMISSYIKPLEHDGRVKSLYKVGGTETGRWSASKFVDGSGLNIQTIPRDSVDSEI